MQGTIQTATTERLVRPADFDTAPQTIDFETLLATDVRCRIDYADRLLTQANLFDLADADPAVEAQSPRYTSLVKAVTATMHRDPADKQVIHQVAGWTLERVSMMLNANFCRVQIADMPRLSDIEYSLMSDMHAQGVSNRVASNLTHLQIMLELLEISSRQPPIIQPPESAVITIETDESSEADIQKWEQSALIGPDMTILAPANVVQKSAPQSRPSVAYYSKLLKTAIGEQTMPPAAIETVSVLEDDDQLIAKILKPSVVGAAIERIAQGETVIIDDSFEPAAAKLIDIAQRITRGTKGAVDVINLFKFIKKKPTGELCTFDEGIAILEVFLTDAIDAVVDFVNKEPLDIKDASFGRKSVAIGLLNNPEAAARLRRDLDGHRKRTGQVIGAALVEQFFASAASQEQRTAA